MQLYFLLCKQVCFVSATCKGLANNVSHTETRLLDFKPEEYPTTCGEMGTVVYVGGT